MERLLHKSSSRRSAMLKLAVLVGLAAACGQPEAGVDERNESAGHASKPWTLEAFSSALVAAGVQITHVEHGISHSFMSVPAVRLATADHSELQVFIYADPRARQHDTDQLDPHRVAPPHMMITWRMPATLLVSENLAVVLLTQNTPTIDHVKRAIAHSP